jgi:hypothetical protein
MCGVKQAGDNHGESLRQALINMQAEVISQAASKMFEIFDKYFTPEFSLHPVHERENPLAECF